MSNASPTPDAGSASNQSPNKLALALQYAADGWPVFPLIPNGKTPVMDGGHLSATTDTAQIEAWWRDTLTGSVLDRNIGIRPVAGEWCVIDLDVKEGRRGPEEYAALGGVIGGRVARSVTGGLHVYLAGPDIASGAGTLGEGVDSRGSSGYVVAPGSTIDGVAYEWVGEGPMLPVPQFVLDALPVAEERDRNRITYTTVEDDQPRNVARFAEHCRRQPPAVAGVWHDLSRNLAAEAVRCAVSVEKAIEVMLEEWVPRGSGFFEDGRHERWAADVAGSYHWAMTFREQGMHSVDAQVQAFEGLTIVPPPAEAAASETSTRETRATEDEPVAELVEPLDFFIHQNNAAPVIGPQHVPEALWPWVADTAARMGVDPATLALSALVACASVMSETWALQPRRHDTTWTEKARLWGAIVGDPSIMKSPVISAATRPIDRLEADAQTRNTHERKLWRERQEGLKRDKRAPGSEPVPKRDRYIVEGATPEALSEVLRDDEEAKMRAPAGKVLVRQDEISEFVGGLDRYKAGGNGGSERGTYLRLYNGGRYTVDRIQRGSFTVPNWSACFLGGIQPGPIQRIAADAADDGLLQRFMFCVPDHQPRGIDRAADAEAIRRYEALFPALTGFELGMQLSGLLVTLDEEAHAYREEIDDLAERVQRLMPDASPRLKSTLGKWPGLFGRLCLTFHLIDVADEAARRRWPVKPGVLPAATAKRVRDYMVEVLFPHLLRADALMFLTTQTSHAAWVAEHILVNQMTVITNRDVTRAYKALSAPEAARERASVMDSLVDVGWLAPLEKGVRAPSAWHVNPLVHRRFGMRAEEATARRAQARARIAESAAARRAGSGGKGTSGLFASVVS